MFVDRQRRIDGFDRGPLEERTEPRTSVDRDVETVHRLGDRSHQRFRNSRRHCIFDCRDDAQTLMTYGNTGANQRMDIIHLYYYCYNNAPVEYRQQQNSRDIHFYIIFFITTLMYVL